MQNSAPNSSNLSITSISKAASAGPALVSLYKKLQSAQMDEAAKPNGYGGYKNNLSTDSLSEDLLNAGVPSIKLLDADRKKKKQKESSHISST